VVSDAAVIDQFTAVETTTKQRRKSFSSIVAIIVFTLLLARPGKRLRNDSGSMDVVDVHTRLKKRKHLEKRKKQQIKEC